MGATIMVAEDDTVTAIVEGKDSISLMFPAGSPAAKALLAATKDLGSDPNDFYESIIKFYSRWHLMLTLKLSQARVDRKNNN